MSQISDKYYNSIEMAKGFALRGWPVFPVHSITSEGNCTCGKLDCSSPGKHPRTKNGLKDATTDIEQIKRWWTDIPEANIGIATGEISGLLVVDVDPAHGGMESIKNLSTEHGDFPKTLTVETGGNGFHRYYQFPKGSDIRNSAGKIAPGVDIRANSGYVVAAHSKHISGKRYKFSDENVPIVNPPEWLIKSLSEVVSKQHIDKATVTHPGKIKKGRRNSELASLAGSLQNRGFSDEVIYQSLLTVNRESCEPPIDDVEVKNIVKSIGRYPKGKSTMKKISRPPEVNYTANFEGLIDLVLHKNKLCFLMENGGLIESTEIDGKTFIPPPRSSITWEIPRYDSVMSFLKNDSDEILYDDLVEAAKEASKLPSEAHYHLSAAWIMHTYLLEHFDYTPIMTYDSDADRGKTRTGKFLTFTAYRGIRVTEMREANCLRYSEDLKATLFFDMKDAFKSAQKQNCQDILLNRFEKGADVARVHNPDQGPFKDMRHYKVFGATIIATNEPLDYILESRSINTEMAELASHELERFTHNIKQENYLALKERLTAFRMRRFKEVLPEIGKPSTKRLGDIFRPLFQIVRLVKPSAEEHLNKIIQETLESKKLSKSETTDAKILKAYVEVGVGSKNIVFVSEISEHINESIPNPRFHISPQRIGKTLKKFCFKRIRGKNNTAAYEWDEDVTKRVCDHWGVEFPSLLSHIPNDDEFPE